jgi:hypothetical protein
MNANPTVKWYGNTDARTAPRCFFHEARSNSSRNAAAIEEVQAKVEELEKHLPPSAEMICVITHDDGSKLVAFRYTSDRAHDQYDFDILRGGALGLGRGVFEPFRGGHEHFYKEWFGWKE